MSESATAFYDLNSKITVFTAVLSHLPNSVAVGKEVTASRPFSLCEMIIRKGRNPFSIETPVRIDNNRILLFVASGWAKFPRAIVFDKRDSCITFSEKAVTSFFQDASKILVETFAPDLLALMDMVCAAFLREMVLGPIDETKEGEFMCVCYFCYLCV